MKKFLVASILLFIVSCGSGGNTNTSSDSPTSVKGNSAGSNIAEMDMSRMDTSTHKTTDNAH